MKEGVCRARKERKREERREGTDYAGPPEEFSDTALDVAAITTC